jgi:BirA family biotin operon repressor/biotin-[acetyl-CoA-carboxylase] ligase
MESGTHGRKWHTDEKNNIAFSFFVEPNCEIEKLEGITIEIAETMVETFRKLYDIPLEIKFPNDIVYKDKKIGGILTQTKLNGKFVKYIVVGIRDKYLSRKI